MSAPAKKGKKPAHQNAYAFHHNKHSKLTAKILAAPNVGLCRRCTDIIEWRKRYRKYKPLSQPKKCTSCQQKTITLAYHALCDKCAVEKGICAKCLENKDIVNAIYSKEQEKNEMKELEEGLKKLSERERRTLMRRLARGDDPEEISQVTSEKAKEREERRKLGDFDDFDDDDDDFGGDGFGDDDDDLDDLDDLPKSKGKTNAKSQTGAEGKGTLPAPQKRADDPPKPSSSKAPASILKQKAGKKADEFDESDEDSDEHVPKSAAKAKSTKGKDEKKVNFSKETQPSKDAKKDSTVATKSKSSTKLSSSSATKPKISADEDEDDEDEIEEISDGDWEEEEEEDAANEEK